MKAGIIYAHAFFDKPKEVEINTLEELIKFQKECGYELILETDSDAHDKEKKFDFVITIYDSYIE